MRNQGEPSKEGILYLLVLMILIIAVVALSNRLSPSSSYDEDTLREYTSTQEGYKGQVLVKLQVKGGRIYALEAEGERETPKRGGKAIEEYNETMFPKLFDAYIDEVSTELDAVSGATYTSEAVIAGFREVIGEAQSDY